MVMLDDGFIRSGLSDTPVIPLAGVHDNPSSLPAAFRKSPFCPLLSESECSVEIAKRAQSSILQLGS